MVFDNVHRTTVMSSQRNTKATNYPHYRFVSQKTTPNSMAKGRCISITPGGDQLITASDSGVEAVHLASYIVEKTLGKGLKASKYVYHEGSQSQQTFVRTKTPSLIVQSI